MDTSKTGHASRDHSELSGSTADRWMRCPGSIRLSRGTTARESRWADEGTQAHEVAERCFRLGFDASTLVDDAEMAAGVQMHLDHCRRLIPLADPYYVEVKVDLASFGAPVPMWGTCDFLA